LQFLVNLAREALLAMLSKSLASSTLDQSKASRGFAWLIKSKPGNESASNLMKYGVRILIYDVIWIM